MGYGKHWRRPQHVYVQWHNSVEMMEETLYWEHIIIISGPSKWELRLSDVCHVYPEVTPEPDYWSAYLVAVLAGGVRWKGDVIIFGLLPCHFSSAVSPPREEDDVSNVAVASHMLWRLNEWSSGFSSQVNLAFLHVMFSSPLESFSLAVTTCPHATC